MLELQLEHVVTYSIGHITVDEMSVTYYGTQRTATDMRGRAVYGGSDLVCVRGGWEALDALPLSEHARLAVAQARSYDQARREYPGLIASRRNYDVGQGIDASGQRRSGVFEASWRCGGASTAELAALSTLARNPAVHVVEAAVVKEFGAGRKAPPDAMIDFCGEDPADGPVLRYTHVRRCLDRAASTGGAGHQA